MRRFVKSYNVRRHCQYTVVQDGDSRQFEVIRWRAGARDLETVETIPYDPDVPGNREYVRLLAIDAALMRRNADLEMRTI